VTLAEQARLDAMLAEKPAAYCFYSDPLTALEAG